eukprot:TRINITY_DN29733_c0_g1_i2.p1 TRINITY_DN29733_c0_g1~~TRINITY_DN29733_c0_g1_i2.p1  ORF type:complete len:672 (+),score=117.88 TRINITY_DN29733_c0_g1_i2:117-2132(+)
MVPRLVGQVFESDLWKDYVQDCQFAAESYVEGQMKLTQDFVSRIDFHKLPPGDRILHCDDVSSGLLPMAPVPIKASGHLESPRAADHSRSLGLAKIVGAASDATPVVVGPRLHIDRAKSHLSEKSGIGDKIYNILHDSSEEVKAATSGFAHRTNLHLEQTSSLAGRLVKRVFRRGSHCGHQSSEHGEDGQERSKGMMHRVVRSRLFQVISGTVIALHTFFIISDANASMSAAYGPSSEAGGIKAPWTPWIDHGFLGFYILELLVKLWVFRLDFFLNGDACWNFLDVFLVGVSVLGVIRAEQSTNFLAMRSTRILKLARLLRVVRAMRFVKQLQLFVDIVLGCCESLFWAVLMILLVLLLFAIYFVQMMENWVRANWSPHADDEVIVTSAEVKDMFGSVELAMLTLSKAVSGGIDWEAAYAITAKTGSANGVVFLCMMAFFSVAIWNIVASVFVENTIQAANFDRDQQVITEHQNAVKDAKELMTLCRLADVDKSGTLSAQEFESFMASEKIREFFLVRGLDIKNTKHFFDMLNATSDGDELELEYFVGSCLRVKGVATGIDLHMLAFEHKIMAQKMKKFMHFVNRAFHDLTNKTDAILALSTAQQQQQPRRVTAVSVVNREKTARRGLTTPEHANGAAAVHMAPAPLLEAAPLLRGGESQSSLLTTIPPEG